jgi:hypothetical protein
MASYRVDRTEKEYTSVGGTHRHIGAICLEDGRKVPKTSAIHNIQAGIETYWTSADGLRANVQVAAQCSRCISPYLRTDRDTTTRDNLLSLPDC